MKQEIRILIWEFASFERRVVHPRYERLVHYRCFRAWSDRSIDDYENGIPTFFDRDLDDKVFDESDRSGCTDISEYNENNIYNDAVKEGKVGPKMLWGYKSTNPVPSVLLACHESFQVASRFYTRVFGSLGAFPEIWFNVKSDYMYLDWRTEMRSGSGRMLKKLAREETERLRHIICETNFANRHIPEI